MNLFYSGIISFALGILLRSLTGVNTYVIFFLMLLTGAFFVYGLFLKRHSKEIFSFILTLSFLCSFFILGIIRYEISDQKSGDPAFEERVGERVVFEGVVVDEPDERENSLRLVVDVRRVVFPEQSENIQSKVLLSAELYPSFKYGDLLEISGTLQKPENFVSELGREFKYVEFLEKDGIYYQMFRPTVKLIGSGEGNFIKEKIFAFKSAFLENIKRAVPEPESSLSGGLLLGAKESLGKQSLDDFRRVGLIHIVVLSGYNITIVAESLMRFFSLFLRRRVASGFGVMSIVLFAIMTGAGATVVRASIMALLVILARNTGRSFNAHRALFFAGFVMLMHNPKILLFDPSFELSFMATLGLISLSPYVLKYIHFVPDRFGFKELTSATISTQIFILPLLLYMMGELSIVSLPVNLLVLALVPTAMLLSFVAGSIGFFSLFLSIPFGFLAYLILAYMFKVVEVFASLPFASIQISYFPLWLVAVIYGVYGYFLFPSKKQPQSETGVALVA